MGRLGNDRLDGHVDEPWSGGGGAFEPTVLDSLELAWLGKTQKIGEMPLASRRK